MTGAKAIGVPGWPDSACCTASMDNVRIVLMHSSSMDRSLDEGLPILGCATAHDCIPRFRNRGGPCWLARFDIHVRAPAPQKNAGPGLREHLTHVSEAGKLPRIANRPAVNWFHFGIARAPLPFNYPVNQTVVTSRLAAVRLGNYSIPQTRCSKPPVQSCGVSKYATAGALDEKFGYVSPKNGIVRIVR